MEARQFHRLAYFNHVDLFEMMAEGLSLIADHVSVLSDAVRALTGRSAALRQ